MEKKKKSKLHLIKVKYFHSAKKTVKRMKRQATNWEKIFANHIPNKEYIFWF